MDVHAQVVAELVFVPHLSVVSTWPPSARSPAVSLAAVHVSGPQTHPSTRVKRPDQVGHPDPCICLWRSQGLQSTTGVTELALLLEMRDHCH
jgi:hypothetical protein